MALIKAWKAFHNILPEFLVIIFLVGFVMAIADQETISKFIGADSGLFGVVLAAVIGSITLIPGFIVFPTAAMLLNGGAGYMQIGSFISTLMMVGVITLPVEIKYFGKKVTYLRNLTAFFFSFIVAGVLSWVMSTK